MDGASAFTLWQDANWNFQIRDRVHNALVALRARRRFPDKGLLVRTLRSNLIDELHTSLAEHFEARRDEVLPLLLTLGPT